MKFGRVSDPSKADLELPQDHPNSLSVLNSGTGNLRVYTGCAKWDRPEWKGGIYPEKLAKKDFLSFYGKAFNSVELNATFYSIFAAETVKRWHDSVPEDFLFCPKFHGTISHRNWLRPCTEETRNFLESINNLGEKLGPCLLQLHERTGPANGPLIIEYLKSLPEDIKVFVELRHPAWFEGSPETESFFQMMETLGVGLVMTDNLGRRDCVHMRLTVPAAFIRFVGYGLHPTDYKRMDDWVERVCEWEKKGLEKLYFFMHQDDEVYTPRLLSYFISKLNERREIKISQPMFYSSDKLNL